MNEVLKAIQDRRSTRGFSDVQLTQEQLQALIDAALASPTASNSQQWHFSVVQNQELLDEFSVDYNNILMASMDENAREKFLTKNYHVFFKAPTVIFISRPLKDASRYVEVDAGIAVENLALAAHSMGMGSVILGRPMDVFLSDKCDYYNKGFAIPEGFGFIVAISIGNNTVTKEAHPIGENKVTIVR